MSHQRAVVNAGGAARIEPEDFGASAGAVSQCCTFDAPPLRGGRVVHGMRIADQHDGTVKPAQTHQHVEVIGVRQLVGIAAIGPVVLLAARAR